MIDVETTGLSAGDHRIIELAVVRTDAWGRIGAEWVYRVNPEGPVGATHIHGIRDADVAHAPRFHELLPELSARLAGGAIVGHNVRFDLAFLRAEYARAGWALPWLPSLCTLDASRTHLPHLDRRRLADCCWAAGIPLHTAHSALHDARATAALLQRFLDPRLGGLSAGYRDLCASAIGLSWPTAPGGVRARPVLSDRARRVIATAPVPAPRLVTLLDRFRLADAVDEGAPQGSLSYLEMLAEVLEDGELTDDEAAALSDVAELYELSAADIDAAHRGFLVALAHLAADDGRISNAERDELRAVAGLLRLDAKLVTAVLDHADAARAARLSAGLRPLPDDWALGEPLRVGQQVAFTGCDDAWRDRVEARAAKLGVRVMGNVSRRTSMLVTDGGYVGTKAAAAADCGTRVVTPEDFAILLAHLQPALPRDVRPLPQPAAPRKPARTRTDAEAPRVDAAAVRQWARDNGLAVGVRGRISIEVFEAYQVATAAP